MFQYLECETLKDPYDRDDFSLKTAYVDKILTQLRPIIDQNGIWENQTGQFTKKM